MAGLWAHHGWWIRRLAMLPVHLVLFAVVVFFLVKLIPGDPVAVLSGGQTMTPEQYQAARAALGLSGSLPAQLGTFLGRTATLDLGNSVISGTGVLSEMLTRLPETVELAVLAMVVSLVLTLVLGFLVMLRPRALVSRTVASYSPGRGCPARLLPRGGGDLPVLLGAALGPGPDRPLRPAAQRADAHHGIPLPRRAAVGDAVLMRSMLAHLWLPVGVLVVAYAPMLIKLFIRSLQQARDAQATTFRIASGASRPMVLLSITRRALPATVAMFGTIFGFMVGGAVVVEQLFAIPGMGEYAVQAVTRSDFVALRGFLLVVGFLSLLVFFFVDVVTMLLDPRRRSGAAGPEAAVTSLLRIPPAPSAPAARRRRPPGVLSLALVPAALLVLVALVGPLVLPYSPVDVVDKPDLLPGAAHWFGTDASGMDVFSRTVAATRTNLLIGLATTVVATAVGVLIGLVVGIERGPPRPPRAAGQGHLAGIGPAAGPACDRHRPGAHRVLRRLGPLPHPGAVADPHAQPGPARARRGAAGARRGLPGRGADVG